MKKDVSSGKPFNKGKSMSAIQPYQQSRVTNRSNDTRKQDSKVSKVSKANSSIKLHQPLTIQNRPNMKQSKLQTSRGQTSQIVNSRRKIQSHLQSKNSYNIDKPISFRQTQTKQPSMKNKNFEQTTKPESRATKDNQTLLKENKQLKEKLYRLQESSIQDKEKIKTLITRISQMKRDNKIAENSSAALMSKSKTTASYAHILKTRGHTDRQNFPASHHKNQLQTPFRALQPSASQSKYSRQKQLCGNPACEQRRKHLQSQLYKERIKRDQLQEQKREWQRNRDYLKRQYQDLLGQIQNLRNQSQCEE